MKLCIAPSVFSYVANYHQFAALLQLCYLNRRYDFFVDLTEVENSALFAVIAEPDKQVIFEYFEKHMKESSRIDLTVETQDSADPATLSLKECLVMLSQPVFVVLEHGVNDRPFIECLVNNFKKKGKKIRQHIDNNWISFEHAGGKSGLKDVISSKLKLFEKMSRSPQSYLRAFVLLDSDSEYPGQQKEDTVTARDFLSDLNISHHVFYKREVENYLPVVAYSTLGGDNDFIGALTRLTPIQLDFVDIENGFDRATSFDALGIEIREFFKSVDVSDRGVLRARSVGIEKFKSEFPKAFLHETVVQETLLERVAHQEQKTELTDILDKINEVL